MRGIRPIREFRKKMVMRYVYSAIYLLLLPLIVLRLLWKSRRFPVYRQRIGERFSLKAPLQTPVDLWIHAVSLGEVVATIPLIKKLLEKKLRIMVTTTTPTGSKKLTDTFGSSIEHQYMPYDLAFLQQRFLSQIQPKKVIIMETELWPNALYVLKKAKLPVMLMNARLSERSFKGYKKIRTMIAPLMNSFSQILAQSEEDAKRFIALGAEGAKVKAIGNIKFDCLPLRAEHLNAIQHWVQRLGPDKFIWIAASTHHNEETLLLNCYAEIKKIIPALVLMIAPRHPERFEEIIQMVQRTQYSMGTRTKAEQWNPSTDIIILDSIGELSSFYSVCHLAFVGGSFVPVGGHNMLEPAQAGVPVICGDQLHNFQSIVRDLMAADAMKIVHTPEQLTEVVIALCQDDQQRQELVKNAGEVIRRNRGALEACLQYC